MANKRVHQYWIYILTNKPKGILYVGVTGNLKKRIVQHQNGNGGAFSRRYNLKRLVYYEEFQYVLDAIAREKQLKNWHREWKIQLIENLNPDWKDIDV